jgi:ribosomal-protein-alanine acetyltransferase
VGEIKVRSYELRDIAAIVALERACAGAPQWGEAFWRGGFQRDANLRDAFVAEINEQVCGYSVASYAVEIAELESVAVSERWRRYGMGRTLCEVAMLWARKLGAKSIQLEVRESNAAALSLYRRVGFEEQGKRPKYYKNPEEDAVLMSAKL